MSFARPLPPPTGARHISASARKGPKTKPPLSKRQPSCPTNINSSRKTNSKPENAQLDSALLECEEAAGEYELALAVRQNAARNRRKTEEQMRKECSMLWMAHSKSAGEVTQAEIRLATLKIHAQHAKETHKSNAELEKLILTLPGAADKLQKLAQELTNAGDYLKVVGAKAGADASDVQALLEGHTNLEEVTKRLEEGDQTSEMALATEELRKSLEETLKIHEKCKSWLIELEKQRILRQSLNLASKAPLLTELTLNVPPEPKLVDI